MCPVSEGITLEKKLKHQFSTFNEFLILKSLSLVKKQRLMKLSYWSFFYPIRSQCTLSLPTENIRKPKIF